ncbi:L,D-transpeptidase Cds6 family protein [Undibacterium sp.]|jgi:Flp pilus assembly protein TadD/ketosteroid isomerase-like protein|uniref:L,D-transpeptidase Cds6 family protein n=1 Tax=Undibacterium sp. TaxID=1914977 RepID=UPI002BD03D1E|nr:tetratricopeptide repeat protein [Undibacterium sp.]HTD06492.1 tetratricopeptide repeat protein [Undibacterium sp.]
MRHIIKNVFAAPAFAFALLTSLPLALTAYPALADDAADAGKLLRVGQYPEAMQKVDAALAKKPKDAQMRFLKGIILSEQNKTAEAISIFSKLTDDYPELPEPYNNLAVLYASNGQYDKARAALEMAIRTNPTYGTAHENLGDVYAKLASQAYDKALQLDSGNAAAKLKLTMVRNLIGNSTGGTNPKTVVAQVANAPSVSPAPTAKPAVPSVAPAKASKPEPETAKAETKADTKTEAKAAKAVAANNGEQDEVLKVVESWAKAWSNKETNNYLAFYSKDFQTPKGESRKTWADERRVRIEGKGHIMVKVESPKVSLDNNTATVKFRQIYSSDQLTANSRKTLVLAKQDGKWQIKQERAGS